MTEFEVARAVASAWERTDIILDSGEEHVGACIETTKYALGALRLLGVRARPLPCGIWVGTPAGYALAVAGVPVDAWPEHLHAIGVDPDRTDLARNGHHFNGHLIIEGNTFLADLTFDQFDRPARGIHAPASAVLAKGAEDAEPFWPTAIPRGPEWRSYNPDTDLAVIVTGRPELRSWKQGSAWRATPAEGLVAALAEVAQLILDGARPEDVRVSAIEAPCDSHVESAR